MIRISGLSLLREGKKILEGIDLEVRHREIHAVLGVNGTGKSTLAYALMGCGGYEPDEGRILFEGEDITNLSIHERAKRGITLAWQEPARFEGLTVREFVSLGMRDGGDAPPNVTWALGMVNLSPPLYLNRAVDSTLSGGERKRIELASVLTMRPKFAILDEPDSGIDMLSLDDIIDLIRALKENGSAVLLITHREEVVGIADRASLICGGRILRTGTPPRGERILQKSLQALRYQGPREGGMAECRLITPESIGLWLKPTRGLGATRIPS